MNPHAAGIDVHANIHRVAIPAEDAPSRCPNTRQTCRGLSVVSALVRPTSSPLPTG
jgi:hypothetical protein